MSEVADFIAITALAALGLWACWFFGGGMYV